MNLFEFFCGSDGRYTVKVCGYTLDKFNAARGVYEQRKFRSRGVAEKAANEKLKAIRQIAAA